MVKTLEHLCSNGFQVAQVDLDGKIHRFDRNGKKNAWYIGWLHYLQSTGEPFEVCVYGDWKTGEQYEFRTEAAYSKGDRELIEKRLKEAGRKADDERKQRQEEVARLAKQEFEMSANSGASPYLDRKKLSGLFGAKTNMSAQGRAIVVPMHDIDGQLWGLQRIFPDGQKFFLPGQKVSGCFFQIGKIENEILICEGYATGVSIHMATGKPVVCAFHASNLLEVARVFRSRYNGSSILICGDDDRFNESGNVGREKATLAAQKNFVENVFPQFSNAESKGTDFNDLHCEEGLEVVRDQIAGTPVNSNYVRALGRRDEKFYYTSSTFPDLIELQAAQHTPNNLLSFMPVEYWETIYPGKQGVNWTKAASDLMHQCSKAGIFKFGQVRGTGAWNEKGGLVLNLGDHLYANGRRSPISIQSKEFIYRMRDSLEPISEPATLTETARFLEIVEGINFRNPREGKIFLAGWLAIARLGGALSWRPHIWLTGPSGCGKSELMKYLVVPLIGKFGINALGSSSEAGIRQNLRTDSLVVICDEPESQDKKTAEKIKGIVSLARLASNEIGGSIMRGTPGGQSQQFAPRSCFVLACIRAALNNAADDSRFAKIHLQSEGNNAEQWEDLKAELLTLHGEFPERLFARMVKNWDLLNRNAKIFYDAISKKESPRIAQQYSMILAGYQLLQSNEEITPTMAQVFVGQIDFSEDKSRHASDEENLLEYLLNSRISVMEGGTRIDISIGEAARLQHDERLRVYGIRCHEPGWLYVANQHPELSRIFNDTQWCMGWADTLGRLPGASKARTRFGGNPQHCVKLPYSSAP